MARSRLQHVEVKFYLVVSLLYFFFGARGALVGLCIGFFTPMFAGAILPLALAGAVYSTCDFLNAWHWGWFILGALYYRRSKHPWSIYLAVALSALLVVRLAPSERLGGAVATGLFFLVQVSPRLQAIVSSRALVFLGLISYPLYLVHENTMVGLTKTLALSLPSIPDVLTPVLPIAFVTVIAWLIATVLEPAFRASLKSLKRRIVALAVPA